MSYIVVQKYLFFLIGVMITSGIIKKYNYFSDIFKFISEKSKSKRLTIFFISLFSGILPIPGRVTVSAGILNSLAPCCSKDNCNEGEKVCKKSRSKFGIIDYLATHHYYLWSPLEKTVILPMVALSISWLTFMSYVWPLLLITAIYLVWYIFRVMKESDIIINNSIFGDYNIKRFIFGALPFIIGLTTLTFGIGGEIVFPILSIYYILYSNSKNIKELNSYVNWYLVLTLSIILVLSVFFKNHHNEFMNFIQTHQSIFDISTLSGLMAISSFSFIASWLMGSSGKYAGIVALLVTLYGIDYLVWFITIEFIAYNLSPMHKCIHIGRMYFGTPVRKYFEALILWQLFMLLFAISTLFFK